MKQFQSRTAFVPVLAVALLSLYCAMANHQSLSDNLVSQSDTRTVERYKGSFPREAGGSIVESGRQLVYQIEPFVQVRIPTLTGLERPSLGIY